MWASKQTRRCLAEELDLRLYRRPHRRVELVESDFAFVCQIVKDVQRLLGSPSALSVADARQHTLTTHPRGGRQCQHMLVILLAPRIAEMHMSMPSNPKHAHPQMGVDMHMYMRMVMVA